MSQSSRHPWGVGRLSEFKSSPEVWPTQMTVDPATQQGIYLGPDSEPMPIMASSRGAHGSLDQTYKPQTTSGDGVPGGPERTDTKVDQDTD